MEKWFSVKNNDKIKSVLWSEPFNFLGKCERVVNGLNGISKGDVVLYKGKEYILISLLSDGSCAISKLNDSCFVGFVPDEYIKVCISELKRIRRF